MLARDQNLLLHPDAGPSTGFRHVFRALRLAHAWQKLGGTATLIHDDLPGRLIRQLSDLRIELRPTESVDSVGSDSGEVESAAIQNASGWIVVDGAGRQSGFEGSKPGLLTAGREWKLAAMDHWSDGRVTRHGATDLLIAPDADSQQMSQYQSRCVLSGDRYRIPLADMNASRSESELDAQPRVARKILIWLSDENSAGRLAQVVEQVIDVVADRTSIDIVGDLEKRDSAELVRLRKLNPKVTLRFWASVERRLQSMAPVQLAIVDNASSSVALGVHGIPVFQLSGDLGTEPKSAESMELQIVGACGAEFRRSVGRLIRDRDHRRELANAGLENFDEQAADRVARRMASDHLNLDLARREDLPVIRQWRRDPESRACALKSIDCEIEDERRSVAGDSNRKSLSRLVFRLPGGKPVGVASLKRLERSSDSKLQVGILIKPAFRNQGYGSALLERVIDRLASDGQARQVIVQATANHRAAHQMARKAGLIPVAPTVVDGTVAHQFGIELAQGRTRQIRTVPMKKSA